MKNIKRNSTNQLEKLVTYNPYFSITSDYGIYRDCESNGCGGICRCSKIDEVSIEDIDLTDPDRLFKFKSEVKSKAVPNPIKLPKINKIMEYCIDRLLVIHKAYDTSLYDAKVSWGYYGQEIVGYDFENSEELENDVLEMLFLKNDIDRIFFVLEKEYSFILPALKSCTHIEVDHVAEIDLISNMDYMRKIPCNNYQINKDIPTGVVLNHHGDHRLIDGYHRFLTMKKDEQLSVAKYIVLS